MKHFVQLGIVFLLVSCLVFPALADFGSLVLHIDQPETEAEADNLLSKLETDLNGTLYPITGLANDIREYTVMVYLCGSDLETSIKNSGAATNDLKEIVKSEYDQDTVSVLVMAGGSLKWYNDAVDPKDTAIYEVVGDSLVKRNTEGLTAMGSADTLNRFINYGLDRYPAKKTALIIWDHGGGPVGPLVLDKISSSYMTMLTVREALTKSKAAEQKLEWIGFDACLMGSVEVAKTVAPFANYLIASAETEPSTGWNYSFLKDIEKEESTSVLGQRILDTFMEQNAVNGKTDGLTLSCIDLTKIDQVEKLTDSFFGEVQNYLNQDSFAQISEKRLDMFAYNQDILDLIDVVDLAASLRDYAPEKADALISSVKEAVVSKVGIEKSSGLSTYYPYFDLDDYFGTRKNIYTNLDYAGSYTSFIDQSADLQSRPSPVNWGSLLDQTKDAQKDTRTIFTLILTKEEAQNVAESTFAVLWEREAEDGTIYYVVVNPAGTVLMEQDQLVADYVHSALYVVDSEGGILWELPLAWSMDSDGHYLIEATLNSGEEHTKIQLVCILNDETRQMEVVAILVWDEMGQYYSNRYSIDAAEYDSITFAVPRWLKTTDDAGVLIGVFDWNTLDDETYTLPLNGDWTLQMVLDSIDQSELCVSFVITDYQRRTHSNLVRIIPVLDHPVLVLTYDDDYVELGSLTMGSDYLSSPVSTNNGDIYVLITILNPNEQESFVHFGDVAINGEPVDSELWIEGSGAFGGIPAGEQSSDTLILPGIELESIQTVALTITVVDAETDAEIAVIPASGYLYIPNK